ncbi:MAG: hypothetical protein PVI43_00975 [Candidatus Bathyarchaeota archaeon]|jgi:hypothetical protein
MKKELEKYLWDNIRTATSNDPFPRDIIKDMLNKHMIVSAKQAWKTLEKWERKGLYEYGSTLDLGWKK